MVTGQPGVPSLANTGMETQEELTLRNTRDAGRHQMCPALHLRSVFNVSERLHRPWTNIKVQKRPEAAAGAAGRGAEWAPHGWETGGTSREVPRETLWVP